MQGIPGSGKSTMAKLIAEDRSALVFSTDEFWYQNSDKYEYNSDRVGEAHAWNQRRALEAMQRGDCDVVIDNTNIEQKAIDPYLAFAKMYSYTPVVVRVQVALEEAIRRNNERSKDRRIPEHVIMHMHLCMVELKVG